MRLIAGTDIYLGPFLATISDYFFNKFSLFFIYIFDVIKIYYLAKDSNYANTMNISYGVGNCAEDHSKCLAGFFCSSTDSCQNACHVTCLRCTGVASTNCSTCSPLSSRAFQGPDAINSCGGCNKDF